MSDHGIHFAESICYEVRNKAAVGSKRRKAEKGRWKAVLETADAYASVAPDLKSYPV